MPFSTTNKAVYQQFKSSLLLLPGRKKLTINNTNYHWLWWVQHILYWQYKNHTKENTAIIICDSLNHSQENFVIEIKQISSSCPDPVFFKNEFPNPILIRKNRKYPAGHPNLILPMLTSGIYIYLTTYRALTWWYCLHYTTYLLR